MNIWSIGLIVLTLTTTIIARNAPLAIPAGTISNSGFDTVFVAKCALFLAFLLSWTVGMGKLFKWLFRLPVTAGQIIAGILLGPSLFDIGGFYFFAAPLYIFDTASGHVFSFISSDLFIFFIVVLSSVLTVSYLLWLAGHETDVKDIIKVGGVAVSAGLLGALLPIIATAGVLLLLFPWWYTLIQSVGLGLIFSATSVSIPVAMLFAYKKMHLKSSKATLGAAVIDDIAAVILLSLFLILVQSGTFGGACAVDLHASSHGCKTITEAIVYMIVSFLLLCAVGYYVIPPVIRLLKKNHSTYMITAVANSIMLLYFAGAELIGGLAGITGAYFAGLFHRWGDTQHQAEKTIAPFVNAILLPIFLGSIGLHVNLQQLSFVQWGIVILLLLIAIISKLVSCFVAAYSHNLTTQRKDNYWTLLETYLFGSSMVARGEVGLVIATILHGSHIISPQQYVMSVVVIVLTTIAAPIMLALGFHWLEIMPATGGAVDEFTLNIGLFNVIGTATMFSIIVDRIKATKKFNTIITLSEGRKIVDLKGHAVKIILDPEGGILFKGDRRKIEDILHMVKGAVSQELARLSSGD